MSNNNNFAASEGLAAMGVFGGCGLLVLLVLVINPLLLIWGFNGLSSQFSLHGHLPYDFWTFVYAFAFCGAVKGSGGSGGKCKAR